MAPMLVSGPTSCARPGPRAWAVAALLCSLPALASAGPVSLQGQLTVSVGVTDNVTGAPTTRVPGTRGRQTDLVLNINPGLILTGGSARAIQQLSYVLSGIVYARNSDADTYSNTIGWNGFFIPSKNTTMGLSLGVNQGRQSAFNTALPSANTPVQVQLTGVTNILNINASEIFSWDLTANLRLIQSLGFQTAYFLDQTPPQAQTQAVPVRVGIERVFARDAIGFEANLIYTKFVSQRGPVVTNTGAVDPDAPVPPEQTQLVMTPLLRYRRDFTYFFSGRVEAGAVVVLDPAMVANRVVEPAGGAGLNFTHRLVTFDLSYSHGVAPSLLFHSNFLNDTASLRANILFGEKSHFSLSLGAGYSFSRQLDLQAQPQAHAHSILVDATLAYAPLRVLSFFLRYNLIDQIGYDTDPLPLPTYYRNTLLFGVSAIYPADSVAQMPNNTLGVRADRRDDGQIQTSNSSNPAPSGSPSGSALGSP